MKKIILIIIGIVFILIFEEPINNILNGINLTLLFVGLGFFIISKEIDTINRKIENLENNKMDCYNEEMDEN